MKGDQMEDKEFAQIIEQAIKDGITPGDFIDEFDVSIGTITRWMYGKSLPLLPVRQSIVEWIKTR